MAKKTKACKTNGSCSKKDCGKTCATTSVKQSVPLKVNVVQPTPPATQQLTSDNSPEAIRNSANKFYDMFDRYDKLRVLARKLNGLPQSGEYPAGVKIDKVDLAFTVDGQAHTAVISGSRIVGELAALIANELSVLIEQMHTEVFSLTHISAAMQKAIEDSIAKRPATGAIADNSTVIQEEDEAP
jgi:hypothetical protein